MLIFLAARHVTRDSQHTDQTAILRPDRRLDYIEKYQFAGFDIPDPFFHHAGLFIPDDFFILGTDHVGLQTMRQIVIGLADDLFRIHGEKTLECLIARQINTLRILEPYQIGNVLEHAFQTGLALRQNGIDRMEILRALFHQFFQIQQQQGPHFLKPDHRDDTQKKQDQQHQ